MFSCIHVCEAYMQYEISKKDMLKISTAILESRDMDSLLRECLPLFMGLTQCSIIGLYCKSKQEVYHISLASGIFLENPQNACLEILAQMEIEDENFCVSTSYYSLHCYSFQLNNDWMLLVCLENPFSPDFFQDFGLMVELLRKAVFFHEDEKIAMISSERLQRLEESEKTLLQLVEHIPSVFWVRDRNRMLYVSPGYEMLWGKNPDPLFSNLQDFYSTVHINDQERCFTCLHEEFFSIEELEIEFRIVHPEGAIRWIRIKSYPIIEDDHVTKRVGIAEDITFEKTMLLELERYRSRLSEMVKEKTLKLTRLNKMLQREAEERKQLQIKLIKSNAVFKSFIDSLVHPALLVDYDGSILAWNRAGARALGTSPERIAGKSACRFLEWEWFEYFMVKVQEVLCTGNPLRFKEKLGTAYFDIQVSPVSEPSGNIFQAVFYFNDISELVQVEDKLRRSWIRLCSVVDSLPVLVHAHDEAGNYVFWNKESERLLGYTAEEMINNPQAFEILYSDKDLRKKALECWDNYDGKTPCTLEVKDKSGRLKTIEWSRLSSKHPIPGWNEWEAGLDVTEKKASEKQLMSTLKEAEKASQIKSRFLANISHEVRTPISGVIGLASMLLKSGVDDDQKRKVQNITHLAEYLLQIINEILDFSKLEFGSYSLEKKDFSLDNVFESITASLYSQVKEKNVELKVIREDDVPEILHGDEYSLKRILLNLAANAVKFTEAGNVILKASRLDSSRDKLEIQFSVLDSGVGIPVKMQEKIFEPFTQAEEGFSRRYGGTGLGLAICKSLVEMMKGAVWVESTPGEGSIFFVKIPFEPAQNPLEVSSVQQGQVPAGRSLNVLLVEDFPVNQEIMAHILSELGHKVTIMNNGREAMEELERGNRYDLVLMDLQMPVMDGFETTAHIRGHADESISGVPIIALTAHTVTSNIDYAYRVGMNGYLLKPATPEEFRKTIDGLFNDT